MGGMEIDIKENEEKNLNQSYIGGGIPD